MIFSLAARAQQSPAPAASPAPAEIRSQDDQQAGAEGRQQFHRIGPVGKYLNMSEDQKRQYLQIQRESAQNVWAARKDESLNEGQMQKRLKEIHAEQRRQLLALLTPEQQETLKKRWEDQKQKQQNKSADAAGETASQDKDKPSATDDDLFAGMAQDPEPPASGDHPKKKSQPN
jgi:hypothetical protein